MLIKFNFYKLYFYVSGSVIRIVEGRTFKSGVIDVNKFGTLFLDKENEFIDGIDLIKNNAAALIDFLAVNNIKAKKVVICYSRPGIIARAIKVPKMSLADLKSHMNLEMYDYIPVSSEEYLFDFEVLSALTEDDREYYNILAAAIPIKHIEECVSMIEMAGLKPMVVDIFPNIIWRVLAEKYLDTAIVDSGRDGTSIILCRGENIVLYTDLPFKLDSRGEGDISPLAREIGGYLDYFASRHFGKTVDRIYITGELAGCVNAFGDLEGMLNIPVSPGLADARMPQIRGNTADFTEIASVYAGNIGLMLKEV